MTTPAGYPPMTTAENNAFAYDTMTKRIPESIADILARNPDYNPSIRAALAELGDTVSSGQSIPPLPTFAPDFTDWRPQIDARAGQNWLSTDWFFAETYFYRQIIRCVRWWETGRDPFGPNKAEEYESDVLWSLLGAALSSRGTAPPEDRLVAGIARALWGNRIDLSFAASLKRGTAASADDLLVDDTIPAVERFLRANGPVHIIADNAGTELAADLALVDTLLETTDAEIILHLKLHPTFVSDTVPADVRAFLERLTARGGDFAGLAERLQAAFVTGRLRLHPHGFWNSSYPLWDMPGHLRDGFTGARMVIIKGDANYRRMVGDAIWPSTTPFADLTGYFPAPLLALRTLKSDPVIGLPAGMAEQLDSLDSEWRINGQRGVIQYKSQATNHESE